MNSPADILAVEDIDSCEPKVIVSHLAGCAEYSSLGFQKLMENHPWVIGVVMICAGFFIDLRGVFFYKWVISILGSVMFFQFLWAFMLLYKEPETIFGRILLGFCMSGVVFFILFKFQPITTYFTGLIGGLFLGLFFAIVLSVLADWNSFYMMAFVMGISATVSLGFSIKANTCMDMVDRVDRENWTKEW